MELPDLEGAHLETLRLSAVMIKEYPERFRGMEAWHVDIRITFDGVVRRVSLAIAHQAP